MQARSPHSPLGPARPRPAAVFLLLFLTTLAGCGGPKQVPLKNVVLITIDTLRADRLGAYANASMRTPATDRLAIGGTQFSDAHSTIPLTLPSHTTMMTGLYPRSHLVLSHGYTLSPEHVTLAEVLKEAGYNTAAFISSHVLEEKYGLNQGFDVYWERWRMDPGFVEGMRSAGLEATTKAATTWMRNRAAGPFFVWVHLFQPHKPYNPSPPLDVMYDRDTTRTIAADVPTLEKIWKDRVLLDPADYRRLVALYEGEVTSADIEVGKIVSLLEREGIADSTVVVLTADHGEMLYEHDFYFGHDIMLYEQTIRVPMIFHGRGVFPAGRVVDRPVRLTDLAPTILDALGLDPKVLGPIDGESLLPMIGGGPGAGRDRRAPAATDTLVAEIFPPKENWKVPPRHALRTDGWKLLLEDGAPASALFDLERDPRERIDVSSANPETLAAYTAAWEAWKASKQEGFVLNYPHLDAETEERLKALGYIDN